MVEDDSADVMGTSKRNKTEMFREAVRSVSTLLYEAWDSADVMGHGYTDPRVTNLLPLFQVGSLSIC